jgi:hypothetical protein
MRLGHEGSCINLISIVYNSIYLEEQLPEAPEVPPGICSKQPKIRLIVQYFKYVQETDNNQIHKNVHSI